eukprot:6162517-Pyramimonas_sp.AAC.1
MLAGFPQTSQAGEYGPLAAGSEIFSLLPHRRGTAIIRRRSMLSPFRHRSKSSFELSAATCRNALAHE